MTSECGQTLYGECLDTVNELVADESTEPVNDCCHAVSVDWQQCTPRHELVVETLQEPRQQLRHHYTYTSAAQGSMWSSDHNNKQGSHTQQTPHLGKHLKSSPVRLLAYNCY